MRVESPDVAVIGAGPAGMAAAIRAHESGASVLVIDDNTSPGGQIWRGTNKNQWFRRFEAVKGFIHGRVIAAETKPLRLLVETDEDAFEIAPRKLIVAAGAREIFLPFPGWTLPGVMGVGGLQAMAKSGLPVMDKKIVVAGSGPLLLAVAAYLRKRHAQVRLIAEQAPLANLVRFGAQLIRYPSKLAQAGMLLSDLRGVLYLKGCWVEEAFGTNRLEAVRLRLGRRRLEVKCDYAAIAYGLYPNTELASLLGRDTSAEDVLYAGESSGIGGVDLSIIEGEIAGFESAGRFERARKLFGKRARARAFASALKTTFALRKELRLLPRNDTIVCRCEDVSFARLEKTKSFREAKLHTRCGMGPCQGRVCGPAADFLFGWQTESIRPPLFPARLGTLTVWNGRE
jgi:NADPH-dependent 2,4-dienoyl-CoA reductase/sulfur reductase-like enzyme